MLKCNTFKTSFILLIWRYVFIQGVYIVYNYYIAYYIYIILVMNKWFLKNAQSTKARKR